LALVHQRQQTSELLIHWSTVQFRHAPYNNQGPFRPHGSHFIPGTWVNRTQWIIETLVPISSPSTRLKTLEERHLTAGAMPPLAWSTRWTAVPELLLYREWTLRLCTTDGVPRLMAITSGPKDYIEVFQ